MNKQLGRDLSRRTGCMSKPMQVSTPLKVQKRLPRRGDRISSTLKRGFGDRRHDETEMVEALRVAAVITAMQREIVASRAQVRVVRVGLPDKLHSEHANVEIFRALDVGNLERQMAHAAIFDQLCPSRVRYPTTAQIGSNGGAVGALRSIKSIFSNAPDSIK